MVLGICATPFTFRACSKFKCESGNLYLECTIEGSKRICTAAFVVCLCRCITLQSLFATLKHCNKLHRNLAPCDRTQTDALFQLQPGNRCALYQPLPRKDETAFTSPSTGSRGLLLLAIVVPMDRQVANTVYCVLDRFLPRTCETVLACTRDAHTLDLKSRWRGNHF